MILPSPVPRACAPLGDTCEGAAADGRGLSEAPMQGTVEEQFWAKVNKTETCWLWMGHTTPSNGSASRYGDFRTTLSHSRKAHRIAYELVRGPIPIGLTIDHLCRNTLCVNPAHLEAVTLRENILRGTSPQAKCAAAVTCPMGHPYTVAPPNDHGGRRRRCATCDRARWRRNWNRRWERTRSDPTLYAAQIERWAARRESKRVAQRAKEA